MIRTRHGAYAQVGRAAPAQWGWDCRICHTGDTRSTWADACADAHHHLSSHRLFGFQPPRGGTPTPQRRA